MSKIIVDEGLSLEHIEFTPDNLLLSEGELAEERDEFQSFEKFLDDRFSSYPPHAISIGRFDEAFESIEGRDDLEFFFLFLLSEGRRSEFLTLLKEKGEEIDGVLYQDLLAALFFSADSSERDEIVHLIREVCSSAGNPLLPLLIAIEEGTENIAASGSGLEGEATRFLQALEMKENGRDVESFSLLLSIYTGCGFPGFIRELLKGMILTSDVVTPEQVSEFVEKTVACGDCGSYAHLKFLEFIYCYRKGFEERLAPITVSLAESSDSLLILSAVAPLLYRFEKWHLLGKFYKLASRRSSGKRKVKYLEMLADIYENKLQMPDFSSEIHKSILQTDPENSPVSRSRLLATFEDNEQWHDLVDLYLSFANREERSKVKAYHLYKAGSIMHRELKESREALIYLRESLSLNPSFEVIRELSEIFQKLGMYEAFVEILGMELELTEGPNEKAAILEKKAAVYIDHLGNLEMAEKCLRKALSIKPDLLSAVKRLGRLLYVEKKWDELIHTNEHEIALTENQNDIVNLHYKNGVVRFRELGDMDGAEESFLKTLELRKNHFPSLSYLEKIHRRTGEMEKLTSLYERLISETEDTHEISSAYAQRLAVIYRESGQIEKALELFEKMLEVDPDDEMARENIRILKGKVDFSRFTDDDFDNTELVGYMGAFGGEKYDSEIAVSRADNDFWKFLYSRKYPEVESSLPEVLSTEEEFVAGYLNRKLTLDLLVKSSGKRTAALLLADTYLKRGYLRGLHTLLTYNLKMAPDAKRVLWALFFKGSGNPELAERLESVITSETDEESFRVAMNILEKIYMREGDYKTILFLRTMFARRMEDRAEAVSMIDETISLLGKRVEKRSLTDLMKLRYNLSNMKEKEEYLPELSNHLRDTGNLSTLIRIYEDRRKEKRDRRETTDLAGYYIETEEYEQAEHLLTELLNEREEPVLLRMLAELFSRQKRFDRVVTLLADKGIEKLSPLLLDAYLKTGRAVEAFKLLNSMSFNSDDERFSFSLETVESLVDAGNKKEALELLSGIVVSTGPQAKKKLGLLLSLGGDVEDDDLIPIGGFRGIESLIDSYRDGETVGKIVEFFVEKKDVAASEYLIGQLLRGGDVERAGELFEKIRNRSEDPDMLEAKLLKAKGDGEGERVLLKRIALKELKERNLYPLVRLKELYAEDKRAGRFLSHILDFFDTMNHPFEVNPMDLINALPAEKICEYAGFSESDFALLRYARLLSLSEKNSIPNVPVPLSPQSDHRLIRALENLSLACGLDGVTAFRSKDVGDGFEIGMFKVPVFLFAPAFRPSQELPALFLLAQHTFLMSNGINSGVKRKAVELRGKSLSESLVLRGRQKVSFIRNLNPNYQADLVEAFNMVENVTQEEISLFCEKLYTASILSAFSVVPDVRSALAALSGTREDIWNSSSAIAGVLNFAFETFLS